jgi:transposase
VNLSKLQLDRVERIEMDVATVEARIDEAIVPHFESYQHLVQIPGVDRLATLTLIAELSTDMTVFPSPGTRRPGRPQPRQR